MTPLAQVSGRSIRTGRSDTVKSVPGGRFPHNHISDYFPAAIGLETPDAPLYRHADRKAVPDMSQDVSGITQGRAVSSAVEHYVDIVVATGSIPVPPTIVFAAPG